jgi:hypothetical protein
MLAYQAHGGDVLSLQLEFEVPGLPDDCVRRRVRAALLAGRRLELARIARGRIWQSAGWTQRFGSVHYADWETGVV